MIDINSIVKKAQDELFPELEAKIRTELEKKDKDWLIDQIIYLTCERHGLHEQKKMLEEIKVRVNRISKKGYTDAVLAQFVDQYKNISRADLEEKGFLNHPPHMGLATIKSHQRSQQGEHLLLEAQDMLYAALYGDKSLNVNLTRNQEEMITMVLPEFKSDVLSFLKAVSETRVAGTWKDPEGVSTDDHTSNIGLQVEFTDNTDGRIGEAIFTALHLINFLQVNEQILYARMEKVERSSLEV